MACPNKTYKSDLNQTQSDWEILVEALGEDNAMALFIKNNEELPTIDQINLIIKANSILDNKIHEVENKIVNELLSTTETDKIVTTVEDFFESTKSRLQKLIKNKNYDTLKKLMTTKSGINIYSSIETLLRDANKALVEIDGEINEPGIKQKVRSIAITIVETGKLVDILRENVNNIVKDKANAYKNISTLQYYLYTLRDWELLLNDAKTQFKGSKYTEARIDEILGQIKAIEKDVVDNDIAGMVSAFKPYLTPVSKKYIEPFKERLDKVNTLIASTKNAERKKVLQKELEALTKKIKDFDLATDDNIIAFLKGERGDASLANLLLEAYSDSTDPIIASFTQFLKDNMHEVAQEVSAIEVEYLNELKPIMEKLGNRFNPETLGKQVTGESDRTDSNGESYKVVEMLNEWGGTEEVEIDGEKVNSGYVNISQLFNNKIKSLKKLIKEGVDVEDNKKLLSKINKSYLSFKMEFMQQEYSDKYYEKYELWEDEVGQELKQEVEDIFTKINNLKTPLLFDKELSQETYDEIDALYDEYILLGSLYNAEGVKKTSERDIEKVEKMRKIRELNREIFEYEENLQAFEKEKTKFSERLIAKGVAENTEEYKKEMEDWESSNTRDVISDDFWKIDKSITEEINELSEDLGLEKNLEVDGLGSYKTNYDTIKEAVYGHRDEDGQPIGTEITGEATDDIREAMLNLEKIKQSAVRDSGLTKSEYETLSDLSQRQYHFNDLTNDELSILDELKKKRDNKRKEDEGKSEQEKALNKERRNRLQVLFEQLKQLKSRIPTKYYINTVNSITQKYGVSLDNNGKVGKDDFLDSSKLNSLLKHQDFYDWFHANHIQTEVWDSEEKVFRNQWVRLFQWSRVMPNNPKHIERKPSRKYSLRKVKDEYLTGYNPSTKKVELKVGKHIDNRGYFLPKKGKFRDSRYEELKKNADLFALNQIHTKYLLKAQEDSLNNTKLWLEIPRLLKTSTERIIKFLEKLKEKPEDIPNIIWSAIKAKLNSITDFSQGEGNFEQVFADKYGNEFTSVPIKHKNKLDIQDVSLDLFRAISKYTFSSKMNKKLVDLSPTASALKRILGESDFKPLNLLKRIKNRGVSPKGTTNHRAYAVDNIIKRVFEGQEKKMELGKNVEKISSLLKGATVLKSIAFDIPASIANVLNAERENIINASRGFINLSNLANAHRIFATEYFPAFFEEYSKNEIKGKNLQSQIFDLFGFVASHDFENELGERLSSSKIKDALALNWVKNHREWGELFVQSVNALAHLDAIKVDQIMPDGSTNTIPLRNAYELDSKGVIKLKDGIDSKWDINGEATQEVKRRINQHNRRVHGNYAKDIDRPEADTYTLYSAYFMMKRFFIAMFINRLGGDYRMTKYGIRVNPRFNMVKGADTGYYAEILNLIADEFETKLNTGEWHTLTETQKIALAKSIADGSLMILSYLLLSFVFGYKDDDKDKYKKLGEMSWLQAQGIYQSARLFTEATTFLNIKQYKNFILDSPMMASTITDYLDLIKYTFGNLVNDEDSYYQKNYGLYKQDESKAKARLMKVTGVEKVMKGISNDENQQVEDFLKMRAR